MGCPDDGQAIEWPVEMLIPHSGLMSLLDRATCLGDDWVEAEVRIAEDSLFCEPGRGVPAWVGVEYMAQTVAMYGGLRSRQQGRGVDKGLLVGTRRYACELDYFPVGSLLTISAREELLDGPAGVFACSIRMQDGTVLAESRLNVYVPVDQKGFFEEQLS